MRRIDRLRKMGTREVAKFIYDIQITGEWCCEKHCPRAVHIGCRDCTERNCIDAIEHWLNSVIEVNNPVRLLEEYEETLEFEIERENQPSFIEYLNRNTGKEGFEDESLIELKGYFKGLRTAKEILERKRRETENDN